VIVLFALLLVLQTAGACSDVADCRAQAQAAAARGDYETFHDLAWRTVQKGKRNDPELMYLLARAQSLSGRPDDALVMLGRMADLGVATDAATNEDFARVRKLPGWPELEAKLTGKPVTTFSAPSASTAPPPSAPPAASAPADAVPFVSPNLDPIGLAHDAVSRRFVVGDRKARRLLVVDEMSHNVVTYVSAESAGFYDDLTGFTIDARRGDLWVVSAKGEPGASTSMLHKLQLVSGRTLQDVPSPDRAGSVRFVGVAVTPDGTVYVLDGVDSRLYRLRPGSRALELVMRLDAHHATALAAEDDRVLYVAADEGLVHVDVTSKAATPVKAVDQLTGFESLAWHAGALIGIERVAASYLIVRVALEPSGTRARPRAILAASPKSTAGGLARDAFYYLADDHTIRRLSLK